MVELVFGVDGPLHGRRMCISIHTHTHTHTHAYIDTYMSTYIHTLYRRAIPVDTLQ